MYSYLLSMYCFASIIMTIGIIDATSLIKTDDNNTSLFAIVVSRNNSTTTTTIADDDFEQLFSRCSRNASRMLERKSANSSTLNCCTAQLVADCLRHLCAGAANRNRLIDNCKPQNLKPLLRESISKQCPTIAKIDGDNRLEYCRNLSDRRTSLALIGAIGLSVLVIVVLTAAIVGVYCRKFAKPKNGSQSKHHRNHRRRDRRIESAASNRKVDSKMVNRYELQSAPFDPWPPEDKNHEDDDDSQTKPNMAIKKQTSAKAKDDNIDNDSANNSNNNNDNHRKKERYKTKDRTRTLRNLSKIRRVLQKP